MRTLLVAIISIAGIGAGLAALMIFGNLSPAQAPSHEWRSFTSFDTPGLNNTYQVGDTARFFVVKNGYGGTSCIMPKITLYREEEPNIPLVSYTNTVIPCPVNMVGNYSMYFPSKTEPFVVQFEKPGSYVLNMSFTNDKSFQIKFPVTLPKRTSIYDSAFHDYPNVPASSIINTTFGIPVENDSIATKMVGFDISSPTYLPPGYKVKLIKVAKNLPLVTIFASKYPLANNTTNEEFFYNDTGILITYQIASEQALKNQLWMWNSTPPSKKTTIDGFHATFDDIQKLDHNGYLYDQWADLALFKDNIIIGVRGFLAHDDLIKITASMLANKTESNAQSNEETYLETIKVENANVSVTYHIDNGKVISVGAYGLRETNLVNGDIGGTSVVLISLDTTSNGTLVITMPRTLIDSKANNHDDNFTVLNDGQEISYNETGKTALNRTLSIPYQWGTKSIEIIGYGYYNNKPPPIK